ncbi:shikimate dehydrogenase [Ochrobactrum sp. Marseille-Q0166]|uniref:shikimate dehydrogenase family protein n=1 Tax=Ochrobactrum sp. Marseille-Q0166 TaxID=2761105 RepID=UPI0016553FBD|nr:shikimate dehydrogenase [Ochrobactrum sp. Marseille-Q0166]MBC8718559.1 shikimate dehydrogenase [Ochrobactrum sp. Marseille-Q0166]
MMISGKTRLFAIVAHPAQHVRTPQAMNAVFAEKCVDAVMVACDVAPIGLAGFVAGLRGVENFGGLVVTVPHKVEIATLCDRLTARAQVAGAVNAIRREVDGTLTGDLLDGAGFVAGLAKAGHQIAGRAVYLVGAGGAASAIAMAVAARRARRLTLVNRSVAKLATLAARLKTHHPEIEVFVGGDVSGHDLVINATSLGLKPDDPLPLAVEDVDPGAVVAEVIMQPEYTALLQHARARGLTVHPGHAMLEGQLSEMFDFLTGTAAGSGTSGAA